MSRVQVTPSIVAVLLLLAPAFAGCLALNDAIVEPAETGSDAAPAALNLSKATMGLGEFLPLELPSFDGTPIHVDVQLPDGEGPFPVIVAYTPYVLLGGDLEGTRSEWSQLRSTTIPTYVARGYAVATAHVRGTGSSGGCLTVGGPEEGKDGYALVEFLANQTWSNGRVALMGTSYVGTTPISTALLSPPHLTTIVSISAVSEWYKYYLENGEPRFFGELPTGVVYTDPAFWGSLGVVPSPRQPERGTDAIADVNCFAEYLDEHWAQDDYTAWWGERNYVKDVHNITIPVLYAHGFLDENTPMSLVTDFWNAVPGEKRAWFAQHGHGVPSSRYPEWGPAIHRWLDHYLLDRETAPLEMPPVSVEDNRGQWRDEETWPPVDATDITLHFTSARGLVRAAPTETGSLQYVDDASMQDDPARDGRAYLTFATEPLGDAVHIAGAPRMNLSASSLATDTQFAVLVYDEAQDGTRAFITRGYLDARHRDSLARGADLVPGTQYRFEWPLHSRDHQVAAGHKIVVVLKSSDIYVVPDAPGAVNTVYTGPEGTSIAFPVIDIASRTFKDAPSFQTPRDA